MIGVVGVVGVVGVIGVVGAICCVTMMRRMMRRMRAALEFGSARFPLAQVAGGGDLHDRCRLLVT